MIYSFITIPKCFILTQERNNLSIKQNFELCIYKLFLIYNIKKYNLVNNGIKNKIYK